MTAPAKKSDMELIADVRMLVDALSLMTQELERRGIEFDLLTYQDGKVEAKNFERITREKL